MRKCVFPLLSPILAMSLAACGARQDPAHAQATEDATVEPLVVGHSPPTPIATSVEETSRPDEAVAVTTLLAVAARDPRLASGRVRMRALVVVELQQLEALFARTAVTSPDRAALARRLAEDHVELARLSDGAPAAAAHKSAVKYYEVLLTDHPQYAQLDEVHYFLALEHELAGHVTGARSSYYELIKRWPSSKYVPLAYFAFGELFFAEAANDPSKLDLAAQAFNEVLKYPPPTNPIYPDTLLRLSQVFEQRGDTARATQMLAKLHRDFPASDAAKSAPGGTPAGRRP